MVLTPLDDLPALDGGDCLACGRCCHHPPYSVRLDALDERRMGQRTLDIYTEVLARAPFSRCLQNDGERCAALSLSVPGLYTCSIYEERPGACRSVEPGSAECLEARRCGCLRFGLG